MRLKLLNGFGVYILYVCDINNYIYIHDNSVLNKIDIDKEISEDEFLSFINNNFPEKLDEFTKNLHGKKFVDKEEKNNINEYTICIHPSRKCNLKCKYCFGEEDYLHCNEISIETAKKAIDFLVLDYGRNGSIYTVDLSGSGEPLLRFDFIKELDKYCEKLRNKTGKKIFISFATNATLVTDEISNYLHNNSYILYGVSIDGNKEQNFNRQYKNKKPIYNDLIKGIEKLNYGHMGFAVTITHQNEEVDEVYSHLFSMGADAVSMHFVRDYTLSDTSLYKIDVDNLMLHYRKLFDLLIENIKDGNNEYIMPLIRGDDYLGVLIKKAFFKGSIPKYRCGAGRNRFAVDEKGYLYACSVLNGDSNFCVGDIHQGIDEEKQAKFRNSNIEMSTKCKSCWCKNICAGECMANSYLKNKTLYEPDSFLCDIKKQLIPLAITFVEYLKLNYKEAYMLIKNFILSSATFAHSDTGIWAVLKLLQSKHFDVNYTKIMNELGEMNKISRTDATFEKGIHPQFVEKYLSEYNTDICAVCIDNLDSLKQSNCFPAIAYLNKIDTPYHQYVLIESIDANLIYFRVLQSNETHTMAAKDFLRTCSDIFIGDFNQFIE